MFQLKRCCLYLSTAILHKGRYNLTSFLQEMLAYTVKPTFDYQEDPFKYFPIVKKEGHGKRRFGFKEVAK